MKVDAIGAMASSRGAFEADNTTHGIRQNDP